MPTRAKRKSGPAGRRKNQQAGDWAKSLLTAVAIGALSAAGLSGCSSSSGGSNGHGNPGGGSGIVDSGQAGGLIFSFPINGQKYVYPGTNISFAFNGNASGKVKLVNTDTGQTVPTQLVSRGNGIYNLYVTDSKGALASASHYAVEADGSIGGGNTQFTNGQTLFAFATEAGPGAPSATTFKIVNHPSGTNDGFPIQGVTLPFTQFNTIRARFSQPVAEGSVKLCTGSEQLGDDNCTVTVTGPKGNVAGRLRVQGKNLVFAPGTNHPDFSDQNDNQYASDEFAANTTYTVKFGDGFQSASGQTLSDNSFTVTPVSISTGSNGPVVQRLKIGAVSGGTSPLTGRTADNIHIGSGLIGSYDLAAVPSPNQGGLQVRLAAFTSGNKYDGTLPTLLPGGQSFYLQNFDLKLGAQLQSDGTFSKGQVQTPVQLNHLNIQIADGSGVYLQANQLRNIASPTRVTQRLDLNISGVVPQGSPIAALSNGVVNQTALNVVASGIAIPQKNGDVALTLYGSFPISVNQDGQAAVNFELELTLPANSSDQPAIYANTTAPRITAQYPSACSYVFNTTDDNGNLLFNSGRIVGGVAGTTSLSTTESNCIGVLSQRDIVLTNEPTTHPDPFTGAPVQNPGAHPKAPYTFPNPWANNLPLNANPSVLFTQPIDPTTIAGNVTLLNGSGNTVPTRAQAEGTSVVVYPVSPLEPNTTYTLMIGSGLEDMNGNAVANTSFPGSNSASVNMITFNTEPMVVPRTANGGYVDLAKNLSQRPAVRQTAPFLTALTPGLPCALKSSGDYLTGGDTAGNCVGNVATKAGDVVPAFYQGGQPVPASALPAYYAPYIGDQAISAKISYPVFEEPKNRPVTAAFSKPVQTSSIKLANGCLVDGSGNTIQGADVAVQTMNGGTCTGTVPGVIFPTSGSGPLTSGFVFRPTKPFKNGERYWVVVCGSKDTVNNVGASKCSTGATIVGQNGLRLNTTPLLGTGTRVIGAGGDPGSSPNCGKNVNNQESTVNCFDDNRGQGGPDILMPFNGQPASANYASTTLVAPFADTNGNGFFDNTAESQQQDTDPRYAGENTGEDRGRGFRVFNQSLGREFTQPANSVRTNTTGFLAGFPYYETAFLGGARPVVIDPPIHDCSAADSVAFDSGKSVVGASSDSCIPVSLLPGGLLTVTGFQTQSNSDATGRLLLRFPYAINKSGQSTGQPQKGYIVPECSGSFNGTQYDYKPCFVASLRLTVKGPDGLSNRAQGTTTAFIPQQDIHVNVFGPVSFEQDGRLVIATKNANTFAILANLNAFGGLTIPAITNPGGQALQLVGPAIHGGLVFPSH